MSNYKMLKGVKILKMGHKLGGRDYYFEISKGTDIENDKIYYTIGEKGNEKDLACEMKAIDMIQKCIDNKNLSVNLYVKKYGQYIYVMGENHMDGTNVYWKLEGIEFVNVKHNVKTQNIEINDNNKSSSPLVY